MVKVFLDIKQSVIYQSEDLLMKLYVLYKLFSTLTNTEKYAQHHGSQVKPLCHQEILPNLMSFGRKSTLNKSDNLIYKI